jgi:predicted porin
MNKKLLATAVGAALAASPLVATQAKVKVQGRIKVELVRVNFDSKDNITEQGDNNGDSRLVFNGSEDLGNGLKAIGRLAFQYDPSDGADQKNRDQWAGLKGGFGTFKIGRLPGTYKMYGGVGWDPYTATFLQSRRNGGMSGNSFGGHNGFNNDMIEYTTPKLGGLTLQGQYLADDTKGTDGSYMVGGKWKGGPVELVAATAHLESSGSESMDNSKFGARFKSGGLAAFILYEDVDDGGPINPNGNNIATAGKGTFLNGGAAYKFGNNEIAGTVGSFDADGDASNVDHFALGLTHFFSKKSRIYAGYAKTDVKDGETAEMYGAGIRFDF